MVSYARKAQLKEESVPWVIYHRQRCLEWSPHLCEYYLSLKYLLILSNFKIIIIKSSSLNNVFPDL